jgi:2-dehydro-3-deoxyphosphogalactonate aldolase
LPRSNFSAGVSARIPDRPSGIAAQLAVLPKEVVVDAVGGISEKNLAGYVAAGIRAFGLGSSLYRPGMTAAEVRDRALASVRAYDEALTEAA